MEWYMVYSIAELSSFFMKIFLLPSMVESVLESVLGRLGTVECCKEEQVDGSQNDEGSRC
jgi:hypothetical protein